MRYQGNVSARGIVAGKAFCYQPYVPSFAADTVVEDSAVELSKYKSAYEKAKEELNMITTSLSANHPEQAAIFEAHMEILEDEVMDEEIGEALESGEFTASRAVDFVYAQYADALRESGNALIAERADDMNDVRLRLLRCIEGKEDKGLSSLKEPIVLVARDLLPSDTALLDPELVLAIVTEEGGATSHTAIIARSYGIAAISGIENVIELIADDAELIVDALNGVLTVNPTDDEMTQYQAMRADFLQLLEDEHNYLGVEATTSENVRIQVLVNIGAADARELECVPNVDGVGLFRTEFLYMGRDEVPNEEEQFHHYKRVLEAFSPRTVTLRTLDIGGDKEVACLNLPKEENPFLGNRALRFCLSHEDIFLTQLRAALRASVYGNLKIMFPMVESLEDIDRAKAVLRKAQEQLTEQGISWNPDVKIGVMIEIPALAAIADLVAQEVDFASIGTNDLTQYALAVDRVNPDVSSYYQSMHPAMLRLLNFAINEFNKAGKDISVCGEMGGDPVAATALLGMGIKNLSMGYSSVPMIKKLICNIDMEKAREAVICACKSRTAEDVKNILKCVL